MNRDRVIALLKGYEREFRAAGVDALYLFGSVARDASTEKSDIDLFFDIEKARPMTLFDLAGLRQRMQEIIGSPVDLMTRRGIHPRRKSGIEASAVRVF